MADGAAEDGTLAGYEARGGPPATAPARQAPLRPPPRSRRDRSCPQASEPPSPRTCAAPAPTPPEPVPNQQQQPAQSVDAILRKFLPAPQLAEVERVLRGVNQGGPVQAVAAPAAVAARADEANFDLQCAWEWPSYFLALDQSVTTS